MKPLLSRSKTRKAASKSSPASSSALQPALSDWLGDVGRRAWIRLTHWKNSASFIRVLPVTKRQIRDKSNPMFFICRIERYRPAALLNQVSNQSNIFVGGLFPAWHALRQVEETKLIDRGRLVGWVLSLSSHIEVCFFFFSIFSRSKLRRVTWKSWIFFATFHPRSWQIGLVKKPRRARGQKDGTKLF